MQQRSPMWLPNACAKTRGLNPRRLQVRCTLSWRNERYRIGTVIFAKAVSTSLTLAIIFSNKNLLRTILQYAKKSHFFLAISLHIRSYLTNFMAQGKNSAMLFTFTDAKYCDKDGFRALSVNSRGFIVDYSDSQDSSLTLTHSP